MLTSRPQIHTCVRNCSETHVMEIATNYSINMLKLQCHHTTASNYLMRQKKLELCGLKQICPYQLPGDAWIDNHTKWPSLEWPEVYDYLINTPGVFTREAMKNRKSLEAHNQFTSRWVRNSALLSCRTQIDSYFQS